MIRSATGIVLTCLHGAFCFAFAVLAAPPQTVITVGSSGADYSSIQAAVTAAKPGQLIEIGQGTYRENVHVEKSVVIRGHEGQAIVDAGRQGNAITLAADKVTVEGLTLVNSGERWGDAGILVKSKQNTLRGNTLRKNHTGIMLQESDENTIAGNQISDNYEDGICLIGSCRNKINGNTSSGNKHAGIWMKALLRHGPPVRCLENVLHGNTTDGNGVFGIGLETGADKNELTKNRTTKNRNAGILLNCGPLQNVVAENVVTQNAKTGILMTMTGPGNTIKANQIAQSECGISVLSSPGNTFVQNNVRNHSQFGIRLATMSPAHPPSTMCVLHHNNLVDSQTNAYDMSGKPPQFSQVPGGAGHVPTQDPQTLKALLAPNRWDDGSEGNHYSDYDEPSEGCVDADHNGIADKGHPIPGGIAVDRFPLVSLSKPQQ